LEFVVVLRKGIATPYGLAMTIIGVWSGFMEGDCRVVAQLLLAMTNN